LGASASGEFTQRMFAAINGMMLDTFAAVARKDCDDRRRRQAQGISNAKAAGSYRGRPENTGRNAGIGHMLADCASWTAIQHATGCSRGTIAKVARRT
jgi:DNA invertase Pin-like site-specific DNA recombinase